MCVVYICSHYIPLFCVHFVTTMMSGWRSCDYLILCHCFVEPVPFGASFVCDRIAGPNMLDSDEFDLCYGRGPVVGVLRLGAERLSCDVGDGAMVAVDGERVVMQMLAVSDLLRQTHWALSSFSFSEIQNWRILRADYHSFDWRRGYVIDIQCGSFEVLIGIRNSTHSRRRWREEKSSRRERHKTEGDTERQRLLTFKELYAGNLRK